MKLESQTLYWRARSLFQYVNELIAIERQAVDAKEDLANLGIGYLLLRGTDQDWT